MNILPDAKWDAVMWLLSQGETQREIARVVGVNRETVGRFARACGDAMTRPEAMRRAWQRRRTA